MNVDILITEEIWGPKIEDLKAQFSVVVEPEGWRDPERIRKALSGCRALLVRNQTQVTAVMIAEAPRLEVIGRAGAGLDNIDLASASAAGIVVVSTPDQNSLSVAELSLGMMLALARKIPAADRRTKAGGWARHQFVGTELYGKTLGVVGLGRIGFLTALRARAMGMSIIACDRYVNPDTPAVVETHAQMVELEELLPQADFVSCHVPATEETKHMFNYERFCAMKPSAYFLNLSRGENVDERGLLRALEEGRLAGASLDVREKEPPAPSRLNDLENVILTPHIASFTHEAQSRVTAALSNDIASVLRHQAAMNYINFPKPKTPSHLAETKKEEKT